MSSSSNRSLNSDITNKLLDMRKNFPKETDGFWEFLGTEHTEGALDRTTRSMIAMGAAITMFCDDCIEIHTQNLFQLGVTRQEFQEILEVARHIGGEVTQFYATQAMDSWDQLEFEGEK